MPDPLCTECGTPLDGSGICAACLLLSATGGESAPEGIGRLGNYQLLAVLARGGMGVVYRARQADPAREVALKALPGGDLHSEEARQRFRVEAEAMARLEHPAILPVYEFGEEDGTPFFSMKLAAGGSLAARIASYAGHWRGIAELMATVAEAVQFAHSRGVLHRDLKPGNILFDEYGQPFVSDFGLAKMMGSESDLTRTLALMGTPNYMAPELTRGGKSAASTACDVWSLGIMLYELLTGAPPFRGDNLATVLRQLNEEEPGALPREVPRDLAIITMRALQKAPARRYAGAGPFAADLRRWLAGDAIAARRQPVLEQIWRWLRRHSAGADECRHGGKEPGAAGGTRRRPLHWAWSNLLAARDYSPEIAVIRNNRVAATFREGGGSCIRLTSVPRTWMAVSVNTDNVTRFWDMRDGAFIMHAGGGPGPLRCSSDGRSLILSTSDQNASRREFHTETVFGEFYCREGSIASAGGGIQVSSDGRLLATTSDSGVFLWDARRRCRLLPWSVTPGGKDIATAFAPNSSAIFASREGGTGVLRRSLTWKDSNLEIGRPETVPGTEGWLLEQISTGGTRYILRQGETMTSLWDGDVSGPKTMLTLAALDRYRRYWSPGLRYKLRAVSKTGPNAVANWLKTLPPDRAAWVESMNRIQ